MPLAESVSAAPAAVAGTVAAPPAVEPLAAEQLVVASTSDLQLVVVAGTLAAAAADRCASAVSCARSAGCTEDRSSAGLPSGGEEPSGCW